MTEDELVKNVHEFSTRLNKLIAQRIELNSEIEYVEKQYDYYKHKLLEAQNTDEA